MARLGIGIPANQDDRNGNCATFRAGVAIVSRSRFFRNGLKSLLGPTPYDSAVEVEHVRELGNRRHAAAASAVVLLDTGIALEDNAADVRFLDRLLPDTPVVIVADTLDRTHLADCLAAGAAGYLLKDISTEALVHSLDLVRAGEKVFASGVVDLLTRPQSPGGAWPSPGLVPDGLSARERQILACLAEGMSNKAIAQALRISEATVKVHLRSTMRKIDCDNRTQAAIWAHQHGVEPYS